MKMCSSTKLVSSHTFHQNIILWYQNTVDNIYSCKCWGFTFFLFRLLFKLFTISMQQAVWNSVNVNGCKCHNHSEFAVGGKIRLRSEKLDRSRRTGSWSTAHRLQAVEICLYQQLGAVHRVRHCVGSFSSHICHEAIYHGHYRHTCSASRPWPPLPCSVIKVQPRWTST